MKWKLIFLLIAAPLVVNAQVNITQASYWFDDNIAGVTNVAITPAQQVNFSNSIPTTGLSTGAHTLNIRFLQSNGKYSSTISEQFIKMPSGSGTGNKRMVACQYWFDDNIAGAVTQAVGPAERLQATITANTNALPKGSHILNIRFKDDGNSWSSTMSQLIIKREGAGNGSSNVITTCRYWVDTAISKMITMPFANPVPQAYLFKQFNFSNLDTGKHWVHYQFKDTTQLWSSVVSDSFIKLGRPRIDYITPNRGGNTGTVTVLIQGSGFYEGTTVRFKRAGAADIIVPDSEINIVSGQQIYMNMDFRQADTGFYDVVVNVPSDTIMTLINGFKVEPGKLDVWMNVSGRSAVRGGTWESYKIVYGNNGNVDAVGVPFFIAVPTGAEIKFDRKFLNVDNDTAFSFSDTLVQVVDIDTLFGKPYNGKIYCMIIANVPPLTREFPIQLRTSGTSEFKFWMSSPIFGPIPKLSTNSLPRGTALNLSDPQVAECLLNLLESAIGVAQGVPGCYANALSAAFMPILKWEWVYKNNIDDYRGAGGLSGGKGVLSDLSKGFIGAGLNCFLALAPSQVKTEVKEAMKKLAKSKPAAFDKGNTGLGLFETSESCKKLLPQIGLNLILSILASYDPNDKTGPIGYGPQNATSYNGKFGYSINFENSATANAPAQTIRIVDSLEKGNLDLSTFELGYIQIGDSTIYFPSGSKRHIQYVDYRPKGNKIILKIEGGLNDTTGVATWTFTTLDPDTGEPTTDPLAGFLPPNISSPVGQGSVFFTIKTKDGLPTNTVIKNKASIYFDNNAPIVTAPWVNTIDNAKPQSQVSSLPTYTRDTVVNISWSGTDLGAGIRDYTIYVSENGNPYQILKYHTTDLTSTFTGKFDSSYSFYSVATDNAGNTEVIPATYDATTILKRPGDVLVRNNQLIQRLTVYPNPTTGMFTIQGISFEPQDIDVSVTNVTGQEVMKDTIRTGSNREFRKILDLQKMPNGYYTVILQASSGKQSFKLIKL